MPQSSSMGQTSNATDQSGMGQSGMKKDKMEDMHEKMGKKASMTGCVEQMNGKWVLADKKHPDGVELMGSQDFSAHNGHKVKVMGTWANSDMSGNSGMSGSGSSSSMSGSQGAAASSSSGSMSGQSGSGMNSMSSGGMNIMAINVTDLKMESDHCDMNKSGMMKK